MKVAFSVYQTPRPKDREGKPPGGSTHRVYLLLEQQE